MDNLSALKEVMGELIEKHRQLLDLANQKKEALVATDLEALNHAMQEESKRVRDIGQLEKKRQHQAQVIAKELNLDSIQDLTMSVLLERVSATDKKALQNQQLELLNIMETLRQANDLNRQLIEQSLDHINDSIELFTGKNEQPMTYQKPDQSQGNHSGDSRSIFDTKA